MSFTLIAGNHILNGKSALVKASDRKSLSDAHALLNEANRIRDGVADEAANARDLAYRDGLAQGYEQAQNIVLDKVSEMASALNAHEADRRASIADAAMAAVRMMIGDLGDKDIVPGLAQRALDRLGDEGRYVVEVAPAHVEAVTEKLAGRESVMVEANPALGPLDCIVRTSTGRVIANMETQIESLAQRWGSQAAPANADPEAML